MSGMLTYKDTKEQSHQVFKQFGKSKWIPYAKENARLKRYDPSELQNIGIGKVLVCVAMGASLEDNVDIIKKYRNKVDILACDKSFVPLLEHGIKADYVMICDSNIPARYYEKSILETQGVKLFSTCYANILWTKPWLGKRYFYINRDSIESEKIFIPIMKDKYKIVSASSNVSNAMLTFLTDCNEYSNVNWAGYERYLLVGYDYSWRPDGNYYAWNNPIPKRHYMNHRTVKDMNGDTVFTSENLLFSAKWLWQYVTTFGLPVINCSGRGLLDIPLRNSLEKELTALNPNKNVYEHIKDSFKSMQLAYQTFLQTKDMFELARGGLYGSR